jgi:Fic family protein
MTFSANFPRYRPPAVAKLARISAARAAIEGAEILPAQEQELRKIALAETIHFSNLIEGNLLPLIEAERAARGELDRDTTAKIELINYVEALKLIDQLRDDGQLSYAPDQLKRIHGVLTAGLGREDDPHFKPHHEGEWRDGEAIVVDRLTNTEMHRGPAPEEVPERTQDMCDWLEQRRDRGEEYPPPVLAAVAHYGMTDIHPFADGNGRMARLFSVIVLGREGYLDRRLFSIERYYAQDKTAYYEALRSVRRNTLNMEAWIDYFLDGLATEYERIAAKIAILDKVSRQASTVTELNARQEKVLTDLVVNDRRRLSRDEYETLAGVRGTAAKSDLADLQRAGVLIRRGKGPSTHYVFARHAAAAGAAARWTDATIETELRAFCDGRSTWPSPDEFKAAGHSALYYAASRRRGIRYWRGLLGL